MQKREISAQGDPRQACVRRAHILSGSTEGLQYHTRVDLEEVSHQTASLDAQTLWMRFTPARAARGCMAV